MHVISAILIGGLVLLSPGVAASQSSERDELVNQIVDLYGVKTAADCRHGRTQLFKTELNPQNPVNISLGYTSEVLRLAGEGISLICSKSALSAEIERLRQEPKRLRAEAQRLEDSWRAAHKADPVTYPDTPNRDRSQKQLLEDAQTIENDLNLMVHDIEGLYFSAVRILKLADGEAQRTMLLKRTSTVDSNANHELLKRLIGAGGGKAVASIPSLSAGQSG